MCRLASQAERRNRRIQTGRGIDRRLLSAREQQQIVGVTEIRNVGDTVHPWMMKQSNLSLDELRQIGSPSILLGSTDQMVDQLLQRRERLGISYWNVSADMLDAMAPVVERLAGR